MLRRKPGRGAGPPILTFGDLEVDLGKQLVTREGEPIHLTPTEYGLLEAIVTNPGKLLTHQWLLRRVWGQGYGTETTTSASTSERSGRSWATTRRRPG